jgi:uroporphyrinogen-III synthase
MGLTPIVTPLFTIRPIAWRLPDPAAHDSLILTSANAPRHAGGGLTSLTGLRCYAVGAATARAAVEAGLTPVSIGSTDGAALLDRLQADGLRAPLHLCGREQNLPEREGLKVTSIPVYGANAMATLPDLAKAALARSAITLLHSARAASHFRSLIGSEVHRLAIAALSPAVAGGAGPGWSAIEVAAAPTDQALLEAAAKLCHRGG